MALNPHEGDRKLQLGDMVRKLGERVYRLERRDQLTRVHPVTGSMDFVGTVLRTPSGQPVFVASEDGLEAPALPGSSQIHETANGLSIEDSLIGNQGQFSTFTTVATARFTGLFSTMFEVPIAFSVFGQSTNLVWDLDVQISTNIKDANGVTIAAVTGPTATVDDTNSAFVSSTNGNEYRAFDGVLSWRHGQTLDPNVYVIVNVALKINDAVPAFTSGDITELNLFMGLPVQRGHRMSSVYSPSSLYTETNSVNSII